MITATIEGSLETIFKREGSYLRFGAQEAVARQTEDTKRDARAVVNAGLTGSRMFRTGNRRVAQTIRSRYYADTPAGFVHSSWGYFEGGEFVDILSVHEKGAVIHPRRRKMLFWPFGTLARRRRTRQRGFDPAKVRFIPTPSGNILVVPRVRGRRRAAPLGLLMRQATIPSRLDFSQVEASALTGLAEKLIVEIERQAVRQGARRA